VVSLANPLPLVTALVAILPAGALFFFAYGRYDGLFRDNVVFLFFVGGLLLGAFLSLFAVYMSVFGLLYFVTLVPLLYAVALVAALNRRKWQGERHSVFNGGALGLGVASMTSFAFVYRGLSSDLTALALASWTLAATGAAAALLAAGLALGQGVAERRPFRATFAVALPLAAFFVVLSEFLLSRALLWAVAALVMGGVGFGFAFARLMPRGVEPGRLRARRRASRPADHDE